MNPLYLPSASSKTYAKGFKDPHMFLADLRRAINDEASAIKFYSTLEGMTPNQYRDFVTHARRDETEHLRKLQRLHRKLTGHEAPVQAEVAQFSSYREGIEIAFRSELEAAELYRDMYLSTRVPKIRDVLFKVMTDEMEHAQRFSFLYFRASMPNT